MTLARVACSIPGCRCSRAGDPLRMAAICRRHWHMIDVALREKHRAAKRRSSKAFMLWRPKRGTEAVRAACAAESSAWKACVADAESKQAMGAA